ncbi:type IV secretory system conjugative DNA transfer family protein [Chromobacterium subtsugae]|uniref:type IV secretory system conjugative DNA transfer family protein n=1 Tax=Chromobacterium subtsugae TaxID=251747 RepID=UPI0009B9A6A1|nr:type IV secretory system conjugative DNA transfer family protein [Chromobacterium subtsugae]
MRRLCWWVLSIGLAGGAWAADSIPQEDGGALQSALNWQPKSYLSQEAALKVRAVYNAGLSYGAQLGQARECERLNAMLQSQDATLSQVFDFSRLLLPDSLLPPVLSSSKNTVRLESPTSMVSVEASYRVREDARFVTTAPSWWDYMQQPVPEVREPDAALKPATPEEKAAWDDGVRQGWASGVAAAKGAYESKLAQLKETFNGMLLYKMLWLKQMVDAPKVVRQEQKVVDADGGIDVRVSRKVVSQPVVFVKDLPRWKAINNLGASEFFEGGR